MHCTASQPALVRVIYIIPVTVSSTHLLTGFRPAAPPPARVLTSSNGGEAPRGPARPAPRKRQLILWDSSDDDMPDVAPVDGSQGKGGATPPRALPQHVKAEAGDSARARQRSAACAGSAQAMSAKNAWHSRRGSGKGEAPTPAAAASRIRAAKRLRLEFQDKAQQVGLSLDEAQHIAATPDSAGHDVQRAAAVGITDSFEQACAREGVTDQDMFDATVEMLDGQMSCTPSPDVAHGRAANSASMAPPAAAQPSAAHEGSERAAVCIDMDLEEPNAPAGMAANKPAAAAQQSSAVSAGARGSASAAQEERGLEAADGEAGPSHVRV